MIKYLSFIYCYFCLLSTVFAQEKEKDSLEQLHFLIKTSEEKNQIKPLIKLSQYYGEIQTENLDSMKYYATKALKLSKKNNDSEHQVDALYELSRGSNFSGKYEASTQFSKDALAIAKETNYPLGLWKGHRGLARVFLETEKYTEGLYHFNEAYEIAKTKKLPKSLLFDTGVDLSTQYCVLEYLDPASKVLTEITPYVDDSNVSAESLGIFYTNLAFINSSNENYSDAISYYELSIKYFKEANNESFLLAPMNNLADIYTITAQHEKAIEIYHEALKLIHLREEAKGVISHGLANNYVKLREYDKAIIELQKSLEQDLKQDYIFREATDLKALGDIYALMGNIKESNIYYKKASQRYLASIEYNKKVHIRKEEISLAYQNLSEISTINKQYKKSLDYYQNHIIYKDSLNDEQNIKIAERYEFAKAAVEKDVEITELENTNKIQQIEADKQRNLQISLIIGLSLFALLLGVLYNRYRLKQKAFKTINKKNDENKLLMKEIHHRVKNNLQIILSLLGVQIDSHEGNKELVNVLVESQNKIKSMAIIHQNLYKGNQFTMVRLDTYIKELILNIKKSFDKEHKQISINTDIKSISVPMGLAVPLGLIINELMTNSYKYAFENKTADKKIGIEFSNIPSTNTYKLVIQDNGKGLSNDINIDNLSSFGMQLVQGLVYQLEGSIDINTEQGTKYDIILESPKQN